MSQKMQWTKPQLIVLARGTPEETVLAVCKNHDFTLDHGAESSLQTNCNSTDVNPQGHVLCNGCQGVTGS